MKDIRDKIRKGECSLESFLIHGQHVSKRWDYDHHLIPPISSSVAYRLDSAERAQTGFDEFSHPSDTNHPIYIYERLDDPTRAMLEENLAILEGGDVAVTFSTGMGAISAALGVLLQSGDKVIAHHTLYGCTFSLLHNWLPRHGVSVQHVDLTQENSLADAIDERTRVIYLESPSNPTMELVDIEGVRKTVDALGRDIPILVDNTFATPYCQRPLELGATFAIHSLTKNLNGFGTELGGVVVAPRSYEKPLHLFRKDFGASLSGKSAWAVLVYGLPTLPIRLQRQQATAMKVAGHMEAHPLVETVMYPGLESFPQHKLALKQMRDFEGNFAPGNMLYFELAVPEAEGLSRSRVFLDSIADNAYCITLAVSLGHVRTLIEAPAVMTHSAIDKEAQAGSKISMRGIRMSIGLESPNDIIRDFDRALESLKVSKPAFKAHR